MFVFECRWVSPSVGQCFGTRAPGENPGIRVLAGRITRECSSPGCRFWVRCRLRSKLLRLRRCAGRPCGPALPRGTPWPAAADAPTPRPARTGHDPRPGRLRREPAGVRGVSDGGPAHSGATMRGATGSATGANPATGSSTDARPRRLSARRGRPADPGTYRGCLRGVLRRDSATESGQQHRSQDVRKPRSICSWPAPSATSISSSATVTSHLQSFGAGRHQRNGHRDRARPLPLLRLAEVWASSSNSCALNTCFVISTTQARSTPTRCGRPRSPTHCAG